MVPAGYKVVALTSNVISLEVQLDALSVVFSETSFLVSTLSVISL